MRRRLSLATMVALLFAIVAVASCRDAVEPFQPTDREPFPDSSIVRLTVGLADDRTPLWSVDGDSIYFATSSWEGNPAAPSTVVALPVDGLGGLTPVLRNVQEGTGRTIWISAPAISGTGLVAFVRLRPFLPAMPCFGERVCPRFSNLPMIRLTEGALHARPLDTTRGLADDDILPFEFAGHAEEADSTAPLGTITISDYHPFQFLFETRRTAFFRPSWNPDGTELVVSDGLRLLRWTPGDAAAQPIPGTEDGITPAWSPDGEWIAYARHRRLSAETMTCEYQNLYPPDFIPTADCIERRTMYETAPPEIVLVRPDGSEEVVLGAGVDPAWSPDGRFVYAADVAGSGSIVRIPVGDGPTIVVPNTERGIEPAVSPDGTRLAFARTELLAKPPTHDIWVVQLP